MDRLNQADLEKSLLRRDAAMQSEEEFELVEAVEVNLFFPQTAMPQLLDLRHTRNLISIPCTR